MAGAFRTAGIDYFLGGSIASSFQGEPRATNDIDFVVDMTPAQAAELASTLGKDFFAAGPGTREAGRNRLPSPIGQHARIISMMNSYYSEILP